MTASIENAEFQMLFALFVEFHENPSSFNDLSDLYSKYQMTYPAEWISSTIAEWEDRGWVTVSRSYDGVAALVRDRSYAAVLKALLRWLGGSSMTVSVAKQEIVADFSPGSRAPLPDGWKWFEFESEDSVEVPASDRIVRPDHNSEPYKVSIRKIEALEDALETGNDVGNMTADEVAVASTEVQLLRLELKAEAIRFYAFWQKAKSLLKWIGEHAAGAVVGTLALAALAAIGALFGITP